MGVLCLHGRERRFLILRDLPVCCLLQNMLIKVKKLDGDCEELNVDETAPVSALCNRVAQNLGIEPGRIRLVFQGAPLRLEDVR